MRGRTALITGGASGIGAAAARRFAEAGATVLIADLDQEGAEKIAAALTADGHRAIAFGCDQSDDDQIAALFARPELTPLDILFANAGWGRVDPFLKISPKVWRKHYDVNVTGTFLVCQAAARRMIEGRAGGSIVVTTSSGAQRPAAQFAAYCSAKAALGMLVQVMAFELGPHDIRVNAVMPGVTETGMTAALLDTGARELVEFETPLGRTATPEDIADAAVFLAGDGARFITGTSLMVDGGGTLGQSWLTTDFRDRGQTRWRLRHDVFAAALGRSD
jgi:NAD(P)-dependent dehydrogenase (short-subunit alcohol dehydrogenase family)